MVMKETVRDRDYWFPAKRFGWGWGPPTRWQGWAVLVGYFVSLALLSMVIGRGSGLWFGIGVLLLTAVLIAICWYKGEPPRWRWGGDPLP